MVPGWVSKIFVGISFSYLNHEWKIESVVSPVVDAVVYEDLFVSFDMAGGL